MAAVRVRDSTGGKLEAPVGRAAAGAVRDEGALSARTAPVVDSDGRAGAGGTVRVVGGAMRPGGGTGANAVDSAVRLPDAWSPRVVNPDVCPDAPGGCPSGPAGGCPIERPMGRGGDCPTDCPALTD